MPLKEFKVLGDFPDGSLCEVLIGGDWLTFRCSFHGNVRRIYMPSLSEGALQRLPLDTPARVPQVNE